MQNELHISAEQANKNEDSLVRYTRKIIMLKVAKAKGRTAPRFPLSLEQ